MNTKNDSGSEGLVEVIHVLRSQQARLAEKYGVVAFGFFGSRVRGDHQADSDLDILVKFDQPPTLFQFVRLQDELSSLLQIPVDLVMKSALKPKIGERILAQVVPV